MISNIIYSFNLLIWPKNVLSSFFLPKLPSQVFSLANFISTSFFLSFLFLFFFQDRFKDHPTGVGNDKIVKSTQRNNLGNVNVDRANLSFWKSRRMDVFKPCAHKCLKRKKNHCSWLNIWPQKSATPLILLKKKKKWTWRFARKTSDSKCDNVVLFLSIHSWRHPLFIWDEMHDTD